MKEGVVQGVGEVMGEGITSVPCTLESRVLAVLS